MAGACTDDRPLQYIESGRPPIEAGDHRTWGGRISIRRLGATGGHPRPKADLGKGGTDQRANPNDLVRIALLRCNDGQAAREERHPAPAPISPPWPRMRAGVAWDARPTAPRDKCRRWFVRYPPERTGQQGKRIFANRQPDRLAVICAQSDSSLAPEEVRACTRVFGSRSTSATHRHPGRPDTGTGQRRRDQHRREASPLLRNTHRWSGRGRNPALGGVTDSGRSRNGLVFQSYQGPARAEDFHEAFGAP